MTNNLIQEWILQFEYAGYVIRIYPKRETEKAKEFRLFNSKGELTDETIWIPKSSFERGKDGKYLSGIDFIFREYENQQKLERSGYRL